MIDINSLFTANNINAWVTLGTLVQKQNVQAITDKISGLNQEKSDLFSVEGSLNTLNADASAITPKLFSSMKASIGDASILTATAGEGSVGGITSITVNTLAQAQQVASSSFASSGTDLSASAGTFQFQIASGSTNEMISVDVASGDTNAQVLRKIATAINQSGKLATAGVIQESPTASTLLIQSKNTGVLNALSFQDLSGSILQQSGVIDSGGGIKRQLVAAGDANITLNSSLVITSSSNQIANAIPGVTLNLSGKGTTNLTLALDTAGITSKVSAFVADYNAVQEAMQSYLGEKPVSGAPTSGVLFNNTTLLNLANSLRGQLLNRGNSNFSSIQDVGISAVDPTTSPAGNVYDISFDSAKFTAALNSNPQAASDFLAGPSGLIAGMAQSLTTELNPIIGPWTQLINSVSNQISFQTAQQTQAQAILDSMTKSLRAQYASLESSLQGLQSQTTFLQAMATQGTGTTTSFGTSSAAASALQNISALAPSSSSSSSGSGTTTGG